MTLNMINFYIYHLPQNNDDPQHEEKCLNGCREGFSEQSGGTRLAGTSTEQDERSKDIESNYLDKSKEVLKQSQIILNTKHNIPLTLT